MAQRRVSLPGAAEIFRRTAPKRHPETADADPVGHVPRGNRRPTGRQRHDAKITVYVSAEELLDIEHARLTLRGEYTLSADRGRIVREAVSAMLADFEARGEESVLVQRLRDIA